MLMVCYVTDSENKHFSLDIEQGAKTDYLFLYSLILVVFKNVGYASIIKMKDPHSSRFNPKSVFHLLLRGHKYKCKKVPISFIFVSLYIFGPTVLLVIVMLFAHWIFG